MKIKPLYNANGTYFTYFGADGDDKGPQVPNGISCLVMFNAMNFGDIAPKYS